MENSKIKPFFKRWLWSCSRGGHTQRFYFNIKAKDCQGLVMFILACFKRSDSGERCEVKKEMKSRVGLGREVRERL